jgi:hypothetical protein
MSKIIDISDARRRRRGPADKVVTIEQHEKRREFRRESNERLFIQIVSCADEELVGTTISCEALDVSASGLRIVAEAAIPAGSQLDLWVDNSAGPGKFFLSSNVRWSHAVDKGFQAGVELHDGATTDIEEWREMHGYLSA